VPGTGCDAVLTVHCPALPGDPGCESAVHLRSRLSERTEPDALPQQVYHDGSWLWCSQDDTVFDAVKKVQYG
jgi:hypothetical protein